MELLRHYLFAASKDFNTVYWPYNIQQSWYELFYKMLTAAQFRLDHPHAVADRPDITDDQIDRQIQVLYEEYVLDGFSDLQTEIAIGNAVCHRLSMIPAAGDCGAIAALAGRLIQVGTDIESYRSNAVPMKNPSDWSSTACGGLFQKFIDTSSGGVARINFDQEEIPNYWWW